MGNRGRRPQPDPPRVVVHEDVHHVRCADEDDDRSRLVRADDGHKVREWANPEHVAIAERRPVGGWCPAINRRLADGAPVWPHGEDFPGWAGHAGFFKATLRGYADGAWEILCAGDDDFILARRGMTERKAMTLWGRINDHVTIRTLRRLHFFAE